MGGNLPRPTLMGPFWGGDFSIWGALEFCLHALRLDTLPIF